MTTPGKRTGTKHDLEDIIQTCDAIESRKFNPFLLDVSEALRILRHHSGHLRSLGDHLLDMRALSGIARVVGLQSAQLRFQSTSLFIDPEMAKQKVEALSRQQLAELFLISWHPIVELEQLTLSSLKEAMTYWQQLLSFFERRRRLEQGPFATPIPSQLGDLEEAGIIEASTFNKKLLDFWNELRQKAGSNETVEYWSFVRRHSFSETVNRAQLVSFLVTYGYARMGKKGEKIVLAPYEKPLLSKQGSPLSLPIAIPREGQ